ncbi:hypothetical protein PQS30_06805 [Bacillus licheniformis]|uniref:hypothetical protein n=1 Tax=Bacillus TaxID=1386 RepID=UPI00067F8F96|nr:MULTISPECIES: hypothetical protein [Bacillus]MEC2046249.1 hypothetical protein [Bacillus licheniformis]MEC5235782.1 hypothetical protein [Bacillus licheniformis]MED4305437.1 hypothetical protein [Bacillus licheniformis]MED4326155.1 hypothetical protein [Bacillus licheniformis]MED4548840.1 hypothetical protein [Bacillus licheniformis]
MAKKFIKTIVSLLVFVLVMSALSPLSQAIEEGKEGESIDFNSTLNTLNEIFPKSIIDETPSISTINKTDIQSLDNEEFEKEFDFLIEDPVFQQLEQVLAEQEVKDAEIKPMWVPIVATALRVLISKVGRSGMKKGWAIARPYVEKALKAPSKYKIDGPGGGGRIIQVRLKSTGKPIFRLDYYPVKTGGPYKLHYHVPPNMKKHHIIF